MYQASKHNTCISGVGCRERRGAKERKGRMRREEEQNKKEEERGMERTREKMPSSPKTVPFGKVCFLSSVFRLPSSTIAAGMAGWGCAPHARAYTHTRTHTHARTHTHTHTHTCITRGFAFCNDFLPDLKLQHLELPSQSLVVKRRISKLCSLFGVSILSLLW